MVAPSDALGALIAEQLGDTLKLHQAVTELKGSLDGVIESVKQAGIEAGGAIDSSSNRVMEKLQVVENELPKAIQSMHFAGEKIAGILDASVKAAVDSGIREAVQIEVGKSQAAFLAVAGGVIQDAVNKARDEAPTNLKTKMALAMGGAALVMALAGGIVGYAVKPAASAVVLTSQQEREIAAGRDFIRILPQLDSETRAKVASAVQKTQR